MLRISFKIIVPRLRCFYSNKRIYCYVSCIKGSKFRGKCKHKKTIEKVNGPLIKSPYLWIREIEGFQNGIEKWNIVRKKKIPKQGTNARFSE